VRPAALDPDQDCVGTAPHGREVLGQHYETQRQHPKAQDRKDAEDAADDQQQVHGQAPPRGWLPQPANRVPETSRQTPDQEFQPPFPIIFLILPRSSDQCRAGRVSLYMDTQNSGSFVHEPRRTSDTGTVEKWGFLIDGPRVPPKAIERDHR
jgi:hypothetical protein